MTELYVKSETAGMVLTLAAEGSSVNAGDEVATIEAMKMEIPVEATVGGTVKKVLAKVDQMVEEGQILLTIEGI